MSSLSQFFSAWAVYQMGTFSSDQGVCYNGFLRMNTESGSTENKAIWLKPPIRRQFWVHKYTVSPPVPSFLGFSWENFFCIMHALFFSFCLLPVGQVTIIISVSLKFVMTSSITKCNICSLCFLVMHKGWNLAALKTECNSQTMFYKLTNPLCLYSV